MVQHASHETILHKPCTDRGMARRGLIKCLYGDSLQQKTRAETPSDHNLLARSCHQFQRPVLAPFLVMKILDTCCTNSLSLRPEPFGA